MNFESPNFLQSPAWAKTNELIGHKVIVKTIADTEVIMIVKNAKRGRYLEIPGGPLIDWHNSAAVSELSQALASIAKAEKCVFVRFRPQLLDTPENRAIVTQMGARRATMHLAAERTVILDLTKSESELLSDMRRQTRYEVRRAEKLGITVMRANSEAVFQEFHQVQNRTAERQNFIPPDLKTLLAERAAFGEHAQLYIASLNNDPIAYGLILDNGIEGDYYEAASTDLNRKLPGAYALQWQVIRDLKKQGVKRYNLWGIAPEGQPHHRYAGVTTFKTGFGGAIVSYLPAHDLVINRPKYLFNLIVEKIRKKWRHL